MKIFKNKISSFKIFYYKHTKMHIFSMYGSIPITALLYLINNLFTYLLVYYCINTYYCVIFLILLYCVKVLILYYYLYFSNIYVILVYHMSQRKIILIQILKLLFLYCSIINYFINYFVEV